MRGRSFGQRKFISILLASSLEMVIGVILSVSDTAITGNIIGLDGLAGLNLVMPLMTFSIFVGGVIAGGCTVVYSHALGAFRKQEAAEILGAALLASLALGVLLMLCAQIYLPAYVQLIGVSEEVYAKAREYLFFFSACLLISPVKDLLGSLVFTDGGEKLGAAASIVDSVGNIAFSIPLAFKMGMMGIGLGTLLSNILSLLIMLIHCFMPYSSLRVRFTFSPKHLPAFLRNGINSNMMFLYLAILGMMCNQIIHRLFSPDYLPVLTVLYALIELNILLECAGSALAPLVGAYLEEHNVPAIRGLTIYAVKTNLLIALMLSALLLLGAPLIPHFFDIDSDPVLYAACVRGVRIYALSCLPMSVLALYDTYWLCIGRQLLSFFSNFLKYFGMAALLTPIFCRLAGVDGFWIGFGLAPLPALGIIWLLGRQRFGREHFPLLLEDDPDVADYSLILEEKEIYKMRQAAKQFLDVRGISDSVLNRTLISIEDLLLLVRDKNPGRTVFGECCIRTGNGNVTMVLWDSGDIIDFTAPGMEVTDMRSHMVASLMRYTKEKNYLKELGFNRVQLVITDSDGIGENAT